MLHVTIQNTGSSPVDALDPGAEYSGLVTWRKVRRQDGKTTLEETRPDESGRGVTRATPRLATTIQIPPGRIVERYIYSHKVGYSGASGQAAPEQPGSYEAEWGYPCRANRVTFDVVEPVLGPAVQANVKEVAVYQADVKRTDKVMLNQKVFSLEYKNKAYLCASIGTDGGRPPFLGRNARLLLRSFAAASPYVRLAVSNKPIQNITASSDVAGNLTITYTDQDGLTKTISSPSDRTPIKVTDEERIK